MAAGDKKVKLVISYGGEIRRCRISGKARYIGGENRLIKVGLSELLGGLRARLAAIAGYSEVRIRYAIVEKGLDTLHDVESDGDLWRLLTLLYYRAAGLAVNGCRVRAFLFPVVDASPSRPAQAPVPCIRHSESSAVLLPAKEMECDGLAPLARAQSDGALYMAGSSATTSGEATGLTRADSGFEALAAIAEEQKNPTSATSQADSRQEVAAAAAATQQKLLACCSAPVFLVPVAPVVAVFYFCPVIPVYWCVPSSVLVGLLSVAIRV